jgi:N-acetylglucosaminyl-diphospho-decaprenol L-rhamnosyltransferase
VSSQVLLVIVNFNAGSHLRACVASAQADLEGVDWTAVLVDNASTDGSADGAESWSSRLSVLRNDVNRGFGAAVNQVSRLHTAPLMWLLNPDAEVIPGAFEALKGTLERHPDCAIAAPQLLNADGSTQESARGEPTAWTGMFGRHGLLTRFFPNSAAARRNLRARDLVVQGADSATVDWVMGASMLIRRDVFDLVGGFDERFFLYWEDADLCRRMRARGYATRFVPAARVVHIGAASSRTARRLATRAFHRSAYLYYATYTVPSRLHPLRWFAWAALTARSWWRSSRSR